MNLSGVNLSGTITWPLSGYANVTLPSGYTILSGTSESWIIGPGVDLSGADLSGADLSGADLSGADLSGAKTWPLLGTAPLFLPTDYIFAQGTNESGIIGPNLDLSGTDLSGVDLSDVNLSGADLSGAKTWPLLGTAPTLSSGYIFAQGTNESSIVGPGVDLSGADLSGADLSGADLSGTKTWPLLGIAPSSLPTDYIFAQGTNESVIIGPNLDLSGADLSGADLSDAILNNTKTGPLKSDSSAPILSSTYQFVTINNEKWIIGENTNLNGVNLESSDFSFIYEKPIYGIPNPQQWTSNGNTYRAFKQSDSKYMIRDLVTLTSANRNTYSTMTNGKLIIDQNVNIIDADAFKQDMNITSLDFEEDSVIFTIHVNSFWGCTNLTDIRLLTTLANINSYAFGLTARYGYSRGMNVNPPPESQRRNITVYQGSYTRLLLLTIYR